jgi:O-antigen/teichoic acid export membrane protein
MPTYPLDNVLAVVCGIFFLLGSFVLWFFPPSTRQPFRNNAKIVAVVVFVFGLSLLILGTREGGMQMLYQAMHLDR